MAAQKRISFGSDERTSLTEYLSAELKRRGFTVALHGALRDGEDSAWPVAAERVARDVAEGKAGQGVLLCWTGTGVSIAANKVPGVRAALCNDAQTALGARKWNDANVLCLSLRSLSQDVAREILDAWFTGKPEPSEKANIDHVRNMDKSGSPGRSARVR